MHPIWTVRCAIVALACLAAATGVRRRVVPDWLTPPHVLAGGGAFAWWRCRGEGARAAP